MPLNRDIERALGRFVETDYPGAGKKRVRLAEALVNELTKMAVQEQNVAAARELLHWIAETGRARAELEAEKAATAEAERQDRGFRFLG